MYWFGLFKITAYPGLGYYWFASTWYGDTKSTYRDWARGYPKHKYSTCCLIAGGGWKDLPCSADSYFTCQKEAGQSLSNQYCCADFSQKNSIESAIELVFT